MSANSFGEIFKITSFGESHGTALGVLIEGCPAGLVFDESLLQRQLSRRRPGASATVSQRNEPDQFEVLSGVYEGKTLGTPIAIITRNKDARSEDYQKIALQARHGHADDMWKQKFSHSDPRGGGRSSGRETVSRVMGGAVAEMLVKALQPKTEVVGFSSQIGSFELSSEEFKQASTSSVEKIDSFNSRFPSMRSKEVEKYLLQAQTEGQSYGGVAQIQIRHPMPFLGQPVFRKLKSDLAMASMSLGATSGFELGDQNSSGFEAASAEGTQFHDINQSQQYSGIRGGISTGETISYKVYFKPTSSILDVAKKGRHDPCIVPRAIPVLESMTWIILADHLLWARKDRL